MKSNISIFIAILAITFASCCKNDIVINTDEIVSRPLELNVPIASIHVPLYKSIEKEFNFDNLTINNDGVICFWYTRSDTVKWNNDINLSDVTESWGYELTNLALVSGLKYTAPPLLQKVELKTKEDDSYITEAEMKSGKLRITFTVPSLISSCDITIKVDEITDKDGKIFVQDFPGLTPGNPVVREINLKGFKIKAQNHILHVIFNMTVTSSSKPSTGKVGIDFAISDMEVDYMAGYFGKIEKKVTGAMNFNFFDDLDFTGTIGFKEIKLDAKITNYTGIPTNITANQINFANDDGWTKKLEPQDQLDIDVAAAQEGAHHQIVPTIKTFSTKLNEVEFTAPNFPSKISYDIRGSANPRGEESKNFIVNDLDHGLAHVDVTLTLPLHIRADAYTRTDTVNFAYRDMIEDDEDISKGIQYFAAKIVLDNNLPFDVQLTAIVINDDGDHVKTIFDKKFVANKINTHEIELNQTDIKEFWSRDVKKIILQTKANTKNNTENNGYVKVFADSYLDLSLSVRFKSSIPFSIL